MTKRPILCNYNFKIPDDPAAIIDMVRPMILQAGGTMTGESANTRFSIPTVVGRFDGVCTVLDPKQVNIAVTDKPELIPCNFIREQLTKLITQAVVMYRDQTKAAQVFDGENNHG